jgi:hypothetical protein
MPQPNDLKKFQQAANRIENHPRWAEAIAELDTDSNSRKEAKADPKGYLKKKGLPVPDEMEVTFTEGSFSLRLCGWGYCITLEKQ